MDVARTAVVTRMSRSTRLKAGADPERGAAATTTGATTRRAEMTSIADMLQDMEFGRFQKMQMLGVMPCWLYGGVSAIVHPLIFRLQLLGPKNDAGEQFPLDQASVWRDLDVDRNFSKFCTSVWFFCFMIGVFVGASGLLAVSTSPLMFVAFRGLQSFAMAGQGIAGFCLVNELMPNSARSLMAMVPLWGFASGVCLISLLSMVVTQPPIEPPFYVADPAGQAGFFSATVPLRYGGVDLQAPWRQMLLLVLLAGLPSTFCLRWESPFWLETQGRRREAFRVMAHIRRVNGLEPLTVPATVCPPSANSREGSSGGSEGDLETAGLARPKLRSQSELLAGVDHIDGVGDSIFDSRVRFRLIVMMLTWGAVSFAYYGLSFSAEAMANADPNQKEELSLDMNQFLQGTVDYPGKLMAYLISSNRKLGGRKAAVFLTISLAFSGALLFPVSTTAGILVGKLGTSVSFAAVFLYGLELFPVSIGGQALGLQSLAARVSPMFIPLVDDAANSDPTTMMYIFFLPCLTVGLLGLATMPETLGAPLFGVLAELSEADSKQNHVASPTHANTGSVGPTPWRSEGAPRAVGSPSLPTSPRSAKRERRRNPAE